MPKPLNYPAGWLLLPPGHSYVASREIINDTMEVIYGLIGTPSVPFSKLAGATWEMESVYLLEMIEGCATDLSAGTAPEIAAVMEDLSAEVTYSLLRWDLDQYLSYLTGLAPVA